MESRNWICYNIVTTTNVTCCDKKVISGRKPKKRKNTITTGFLVVPLFIIDTVAMLSVYTIAWWLVEEDVHRQAASTTATVSLKLMWRAAMEGKSTVKLQYSQSQQKKQPAAREEESVWTSTIGSSDRKWHWPLKESKNSAHHWISLWNWSVNWHFDVEDSRVFIRSKILCRKVQPP